MQLAHKIRLEPNKEQEAYFEKACAVARFAWNWALEHAQKQDKKDINKLKIEFNSIKKEQFPWIYEVHKDANQQVFADLKQAYQRFFKKQARYPKFKSKKTCKKSFYVSNDKFRLDRKYVILPKIGKVKLSEELRFDGKIMSARVTKTGKHWFISILIDLPNYQKERVSDNEIGVDLGIKTTVITSNSEFINAPKPLKNNLKKLRRLNKSLSRKQKGSKNREKAREKLANLHYKISCIRKDWINKLTTKLCRENQTIVIEDLSTKWLLANRHLARSASDVGFYEFRRQLEYKSYIYSCNLIIADRFYPSSKLCSNCGNKKSDLKLSDRTYICEHCGFEIDRDLNAAMNLLNLS